MVTISMPGAPVESEERGKRQRPTILAPRDAAPRYVRGTFSGRGRGPPAQEEKFTRVKFDWILETHLAPRTDEYPFPGFLGA
jgi:hypothetical protein